MGATGESARRVADFGFNPAWSPDGREVAVVTEALGLPWARITESKLWAVNVETGVRRLITEVDAMQPAWSPDGTRIVFWGLEREKSASQRDLWIVPASGSNTKRDGTTRLTNDAALDWSPVWAPDGKALYFASSRGGTMNIWRLAMDPGSGQARGVPSPVTAPSSWVGWLTPSQRGDRLGFVDRNARTVMYRAPFDPNRGQIAGPAQPIPLGTTEIYDNFVVSPDGESVLFSNSGLPQHIFLARIDGSEYRQLTDGPYRDRQASFSPDGQWVAFQTSRFPSSVGVIRSDGSGLREVFSEHTSAWYPTWSPDGTQIVVASDAGPYILNVNATSAAGSIAMRFPPVPQSLIFMPGAWSSDGKTILGDMADASKGRGILSFSLGDRSYRAVSDRSSLGSGRARYLPDNRRFVATYDDKLLLQDGETGQWREILAAPEGHTYTDVSVSADGRWIAFLEVWDESDIWLAELEAPKPVP
jgi:Tol biopolymer transport system component